MLFLLKKPAEEAFMHSNQELARHAVASEQQVYCEYVSILALSAAWLHRKLSFILRSKEPCSLGATDVAANGSGSVFGISSSEAA